MVSPVRPIRRRIEAVSTADRPSLVHSQPDGQWTARYACGPDRGFRRGISIAALFLRGVESGNVWRQKRASEPTGASGAFGMGAYPLRDVTDAVSNSGRHKLSHKIGIE